ncbi:MAG: transporter [Phycisphaerales bacterium JB064]
MGKSIALVALMGVCTAALGDGASLPDSTRAAMDRHLNGLGAFEREAWGAFQDEGAQSSGTAGGGGTDDLAKKLQNPMADLISVPLQLNYDNGYGANDAERWTLNVQPVIPFKISEDWNLISRTIVPIIYQERLGPSDDSDLAIGDVLQSLFFSPKEPIGGWIIGVGPVALLPTGTDPDLRSEQLAMGPTAVALRQQNGWTYGMLMNHLWHVAGSDDTPDINATFIQPFVSYTFPTATSLTFNTESTYDWRADQRTVPLNLMVNQVSTIGSQPVSYQFGVRYYAERPGGGPEFGLRFGLTFLFPG